MNSSSNNPASVDGAGNEQKVVVSSSSLGAVAGFTLEVLNLLRDATAQDVEAQVLATFLLISTRGDKNPPNIIELAKIAGISEASASRIVAMLGRGLRGKPGAGLIETREDPTNYSRKLIYLSQKGQRLLSRIGDSTISAVSRWRTE